MAQGIVVVGSGVDPASYYNKTQVEAKLAGKLSTSGGALSGFIDFGQKSNGFTWQLKNGDVYSLRPYVDTNVFQLVRSPADGTSPYGAINVFGDGSINITTKAVLSLTFGDDTRNFLDWTYPVGSIYQSVNSTSPAQLFGGTWEQIANDRVLMGASSSHAAGTTAEAGLPNITGTVYEFGNRSGPNNVTGAFAKVSEMERIPTVGEILDGYTSTSSWNMDASRSSSIYGKSTTVQPPSYYVYIWRRVA